MQKTRGMVGPCRYGGQIPAPRQMLGNGAEERMVAGIIETRRFVGNHCPAPLRVHVELVEKFAERRAKSRAGANPRGRARGIA
jgi:hypothetical protein